jgi:hypothetical protein
MRTLRLIPAIIALSATSAAAQPASNQTPTPLLPPPISANALLPRPIPKANLAEWNAALGRKPVSLAVDGVILRGFDYSPKAANAPTVLFFGANGWDVDDADQHLRQIAARGARVVAYDYRGYGFSEGKPDLRTFRADALKLYDNLTKDQGTPAVAVFGFSMGSALAAYVASQRKVEGVVLVAPIAHAREFFVDYARAHTPQIDPNKLITTPDADDVFGEADLIAQSTAPLLVVHGEADDIVPYNEGKEVFAASPSAQKTFVSLPGEKHNGAVDNETALAAFGTFFATLR